jgi:hypothetical protein
LKNLKFAEDLYRYFGQQPYWTERKMVGATAKKPVEEQKAMPPEMHWY